METWDVYDINRQRTGEVVPRGRIVADGHFHVVVHLCIFDTQGRLLIQRRVDNKETWPGRWDFSLGGSIIRGETSAQGLAREAQEELGLDLDPSSLRPTFTTNFPAGFDDFYIIQAEPKLDALAVPNNEVAEVRWASLEEVIKLLESGDFISYRESVLRFIFDFVGYPDIFVQEPQWR